MKKKILVTAIMLALFTVAVFAQNADALTRMLETEKATVGQAAYFFGVYLDAVPEDATEAEAVAALQALRICKAEGSDSFLTYKIFAGMIMKTWNIKGGLMYTLTGADRYALRELQARGFISAAADPMAVVSGYEALAVINDCLLQLGGE